MDEVDKIIIHSLKQIGCKIERNNDDVVYGLKDFTPDLLVRTVSKCLQEIKQDSEISHTLPENVAQRFAVATSLAEMCSACGYSADIGYQTFLYPNEVDIRRLFMFLIEQLPKEQVGSLNDSQQGDRDDFEILMSDVRKNIMQQLKLPWVPQYCRGISNRKTLGCTGLSVNFNPQLNLNIPKIEKSEKKTEVQPIITYQVPSVFQQASIREYDLISSVLHKNAIETYAPTTHSYEKLQISLDCAVQPLILSPTKSFVTGAKNEDCITNKIEIPIKSPIGKTSAEVEYLKVQNEQKVKEFQDSIMQLNQLRQKRSEIEHRNEDMRKIIKNYERTSVILENPEENVHKLESLIEKTREKRLVVETQWQLHRNKALKQIDELEKVRQSNNLRSIQELRGSLQKLQATLVEKNRVHAILDDELKKVASGVAFRKEYTRRIYEFIGNIRKQREGIYKILDDTKDLQKQMNSISAQLNRQFNYTDDLLFQSAKHDLHAKQAYKLLAFVRESCDAICNLVQQTGQLTNESRDLEVQIDLERMRNVAGSLEKITLDIQKFGKMIKIMKSDINQVQDEIHSG